MKAQSLARRPRDRTRDRTATSPDDAVDNNFCISPPGLAVGPVLRSRPGGAVLRSAGDDLLGGTAVPANTLEILRRRRGNGQPLPDRVAGPMGEQLGVDLSAVRVHSDAESHSVSRSLQATAFTHGSDIYFAQGAYNPGSTSGQLTLAHELAHVTQQSGGATTTSTPVIGRADDPAEAQADRVAHSIVHRLRLGASASAEAQPADLQRKWRSGGRLEAVRRQCALVEERRVDAGTVRMATGQLRRLRRRAEAQDIRTAAGQAVSGSSRRLPFLDSIQAAFGRYDVSDIRAHTDQAAAEGSAAMGARAFATGNHIAFAGEPDLHSAAHEAAHVVQQRAGVALTNGVGHPGDVYERHAEAVAAAVEQGSSAEHLLSTMAGGADTADGGAGRSGVQRLGAIQLLFSSDDKEELAEYIQDMDKQVGPGNISKEAIKDKVRDLSDKYKDDEKKGMRLAKTAAFEWVKSLAPEAPSEAPPEPEYVKKVDATPMEFKERTDTQERKDKAQAGEPDAEPQGDEKPKKTKKPRKTETPLDVPLTEIAPPALKSGWKGAATTAPAPTAPAQKAPKAPCSRQGLEIYDKFEKWNPEPTAQGGCNGMGLSLKDLRYMISKVEGDDKERFWVRTGPGTGVYDIKSQVKFIHAKTKKAPNGKCYTYHISVKPDHVATLKAEFDLEYEQGW